MNSTKLKEALVSCSLVLSMLVSGCSTTKDNSKKIYAHDTFIYTEISYNEDGSIVGTLPANKVDEFVKIITFKQGDVTFTRLVAIEDHKNGSMHAPHYRITKYYDLDTGSTLIAYTNGDMSGKTTDHIRYSVGENLEILAVRDFMPYLYQEGMFLDVYDINNILEFYHEKVEPTLEESDKVVLN